MLLSLLFFIKQHRFSFSCRHKKPLCPFSAALNFTSNWAEARVTTNATYKSFSNAIVNAEIGLHVGLYGINVTLKGESLLLLLCAHTVILSNGSFKVFSNLDT